ncbi:hypothetical protein [Fictibacillus phosphorivorans]|uniref:hypothetical protein n=1 Tax=Fictibacillus phosphorivorans TaxID=1221500 RepID=UPI00203E0B47|nr:hypothetical protein [Fictibacillus phosphorivorans]MCM3717337.1 hypothetical protein [Fictibacillus phosphorivorans]MCM3775032.1 hypothetical protein [Fictibacillus phosphorivorans]
MKPWIKAGLITAGLIVLISTFFIGDQADKTVVQTRGLDTDTLYIVSVLLGASLIAVGLRMKGDKRKDSTPKNSAK